MSRPIVWAAGTLVSLALSSTLTGVRMAERFDPPAAKPAAVQAADDMVVTVAADLRGHFVVHPALNGQRLRMLVDTGASLVALSFEDAQMAGIHVGPIDFTRKLATANGTVEAAPVRIEEVRLGDIAVRNVDAVVLPRGRLDTSLLGMSFLKRLGGFEIARGRLTLKGSSG